MKFIVFDYFFWKNENLVVQAEKKPLISTGVQQTVDVLFLAICLSFKKKEIGEALEEYDHHPSTKTVAVINSVAILAILILYKDTVLQNLVGCNISFIFVKETSSMVLKQKTDSGGEMDTSCPSEQQRSSLDANQNQTNVCKQMIDTLSDDSYEACLQEDFALETGSFDKLL